MLFILPVMDCMFSVCKRRWLSHISKCTIRLAITRVFKMQPHRCEVSTLPYIPEVYLPNVILKNCKNKAFVLGGENKTFLLFTVVFSSWVWVGAGSGWNLSDDIVITFVQSPDLPPLSSELNRGVVLSLEQNCSTAITRDWSCNMHGGGLFELCMEPCEVLASTFELQPPHFPLKLPSKPVRMSICGSWDPNPSLVLFFCWFLLALLTALQFLVCSEAESGEKAWPQAWV